MSGGEPPDLEKSKYLENSNRRIWFLVVNLEFRILIKMVCLMTILRQSIKIAREFEIFAQIDSCASAQNSNQPNMCMGKSSVSKVFNA